MHGDRADRMDRDARQLAGLKAEVADLKDLLQREMDAHGENVAELEQVRIDLATADEHVRSLVGERHALRAELNEALDGWNAEKKLRKDLCNEADERIERMQLVIDAFCRVDDTANTNEQLAAVREAYELLRAYREDTGA